MKKKLFLLLVALFMLMPFISVNAEGGTHTVTFDINGGRENERYPLETLTVNSGSTFTLPELPELPEIELVENGIYIVVNPPEGKVFDAYEVDGEKKEAGEEITINKDTVIKYLWKDIIYIHKIEATIEEPIVGNIVDADYSDVYDDYDPETQTNRPIVNVPDGANYYVVYDATYWYTGEYDVFRGTIEKGNKYKALIYFSTIDNQYEFADDVVVVINGNEISNFDNFNLWVNAPYEIRPAEDNIGIEKYTVKPSNNDYDISISFTALMGDSYRLHINDILSITDEDIQHVVDLFNDPEYSFELFKEQCNKLINHAKKAANGKGTLLKLYEMYLYNNEVEMTRADGGFKIKLRITDDIKDYDSYKLIYIADDGTAGETIELRKNGKYLEGTLPHLSMYALVGTKNESNTLAVTSNYNTIKNPKTKDNIIFYISVLGLSIIGLAITTIFTRKKILIKNN